MPSQIIDNFPREVKNEFMDMIQDEKYECKDRLSTYKWTEMHLYLDNPHRPTPTQADRNIKYFAKEKYMLVDRRLHRKPEGKYTEPRYAIPPNEVFEVIKNEHLRLHHIGRDKLYYEVCQRFHGIKKEECAWISWHCRHCTLNRVNRGKRPLQPIEVSEVWERVQVDLIDMRHTPDGRYAWICHIKDHYSKFTQLYALESKHAEGIADCLVLFIQAFYPPKILQCDNGKEFKGAVLILLRKYGIKLINGAPRTPQTQGLVEQANGVVEQKIAAWKVDNGSTAWKPALPEICMSMNKQYHSAIKACPWQVVFRDRTAPTWLTAEERRLHPGVVCEDGSIMTELALEEAPQAAQAPQATTTIPTTSPSSDSSELPADYQADLQAQVENEEAVYAMRSNPLRGITDPVLQGVRLATIKSKDLMVAKYAKQREIEEFAIGDIVSLNLPRGTRTSTDNRRVFVKVLAMEHPYKYRIQTEFGVIKNLIPTRELNRLPDSVTRGMDIQGPRTEVLLSTVAKKVSTSDRVVVSCKCKGLCATKRCNCWKNERKCSVYCHADKDHDCGWLASMALRTEKALMPRVDSDDEVVVEPRKSKRQRANTAGQVRG
jgi:hypothetical protein